MTSPDVSPYVDAQLFTSSRQDIFDSMMALAQLRFPDWQPLEAHTETLLMEIFADVVYELAQRLNLAPAAAFEGLLRVLQILRDPGARPTGTISVAVAASPSTQTIPLGSRLRWEAADGSVSIDLLTSDAVAFPSGSGALPVPVVGVNETSEHNGVSGGTVVVVDAPPFIDSVSLTGSLTGGRDAEDSPTYLARGALRLSRLTSTLVGPEQFETAALEDSNVRRAHVLDNFNSDAGTGVPGDHPGHVTVAVSGAAGASLSSGAKDDLLASLNAQKYSLLTVHLSNPTLTPVAITAQLQREPAYTDGQIKTAAEAALTAYLNPDNWPYQGNVYRNELISLLDQVPGVRRVIDVTVPSGDVALSGVAPLATAGTLDITTTL